MLIERPGLLCLRYEELPSTGSKEDFGFTLYRGVIVRWDEDYDTRILDFIDDMKEFESEGLVAVHESKGNISFLWSNVTDIPPIAEATTVETRNGDVWNVLESRIAS